MNNCAFLALSDCLFFYLHMVREGIVNLILKSKTFLSLWCNIDGSPATTSQCKNIQHYLTSAPIEAWNFALFKEKMATRQIDQLTNRQTCGFIGTLYISDNWNCLDYCKLPSCQGDWFGSARIDGSSSWSIQPGSWCWTSPERKKS